MVRSARALAIVRYGDGSLVDKLELAASCSVKFGTDKRSGGAGLTDLAAKHQHRDPRTGACGRDVIDVLTPSRAANSTTLPEPCSIDGTGSTGCGSSTFADVAE